ncbi:MAG: ASCH domain-containing protein [Bacteroidales bacterium]|nr:ASCH domain-containing protein [Bacteroidales bacterium]
MKILNLIIKQKYLDLILSGQKVQEFREVRPTTEKKLIQLDEEGYDICDENENALPIEYDAIRFYVGYNPDRDTALVKVESAYTEIFVDEKGEPIWYEYKGKDYVAQQVVYNLGEILEKNIHPKKHK